MIDNYTKTIKLLEQMKLNLPISVYPTKMLIQFLQEQPVATNTNLKLSQMLLIEEVFYLGDAGGIACSIRPPQEATGNIVVSLTHLRVNKSDPLFKEITSYQKARVRKLRKPGATIR